MECRRTVGPLLSVLRRGDTTGGGERGEALARLALECECECECECEWLESECECECECGRECGSGCT